MLYHERERKNKENANFVYIVYLLTKLCNIFDEAFFIDVSIHVLFLNPANRAHMVHIGHAPRGVIICHRLIMKIHEKMFFFKTTTDPKLVYLLCSIALHISCQSCPCGHNGPFVGIISSLSLTMGKH